jgi:hypothetical protein
MSCLFEALAAGIPGQNSAILREKICDYLESNLPLIEGLDTASVLLLESIELHGLQNSYIPKMRLHSTWGGGVEIAAFCRIFPASVTVETLGIPGNQQTLCPMHFVFCSHPQWNLTLNWRDNHYTLSTVTTSDTQ